MQKSGLTSPLLVKYLDAYEKNPKSRVFAPLAETYRKLGMRDKAFEILKQGIKNHPSYLMGYLGLAFCYKDIGKLELAYSTIRPFVESSRDNIRMQKLFGSICYELNYFEEALDTYKFLLFLNPRDKAISKVVKKIEEQFNNSIVRNDSNLSEIPTDDISLFGDNENEKSRWIQKDLTKPYSNPGPEPKKIGVKNEEDSFILNKKVKFDEVKMISNNKKEVSSTQLMMGQVEPNSNQNLVSKEKSEEKESESIVTLTLVDLYLSQGYRDKALDVLEKLISLNPNDFTLKKKRKELEGDFGDTFERKEKESNQSVQDDKDFLIVKNRMNSFLNELKKRAETFKEA